MKRLKTAAKNLKGAAPAARCLCCSLTIPTIAAIVVAFIVLRQVIYRYNIESYVGLWKPPPLSMRTTKLVDGTWTEHVSVTMHSTCEFEGIPQKEERRTHRTYSYIDHTHNSSLTHHHMLKTFDEPVMPHELTLSRNWHIVPDKSCVPQSSLDTNVCLFDGDIKKGYKKKETAAQKTDNGTHLNVNVTNSDVRLIVEGSSVSCLPSVVIIGFEKCSTTELMLWLVT
jgi:hypothetical protein